MSPDSNTEPRSWNFRAAIAVLAAILAAGCARTPDALATFGSQTLTIADLESYLLSFPEAERQVPPSDDAADWMEGKIRRLALERVLEASDEATQLREDPQNTVRQLWARSSTLVSALSKEMIEGVTPSPSDIAERAAELVQKRKIEPLLSFQHIYFRLGLAKTPLERAEVRELADSVLADALQGTDFPTLVRLHSGSSDATSGGLVTSVRPSDLDEASQKALADLSEDGLSPVIESRTGLHIFRLLRRLEPETSADTQLEDSARNLLIRERAEAAHKALLEGARSRVEIQTEKVPWKIGSWTLGSKTLDLLLPQNANDPQRQSLIEHFILASEAQTRGLETPELITQLEARFRLELLEHLFSTERLAFDQAVSSERLRAFHAAQPSLFNEPERVQIMLIFVPQGADSFSAQQRAEALVADLRAGASFSDLAREISTGPMAQQGGDLGLLEARATSRLGTAVQAAIPSLEEGDISDPIYCTNRVLSRDPWLLRGGFAIVRVEQRVAEREREFEEAIDDVRRAYSSDYRAELDDELHASILEKEGFRILRLPEVSEFLR